MRARPRLLHLAGLALLAGAATPRPLDPPGDLLAFHAVAQAAAAQPPDAASLHVACTQRVGTRDTHVDAAGWWTLLAPEGGRAVIAVFTRDPLTKPGEAISTTVRYGPFPTAKVTPASSLDWAWIWDRDGDGRADYAAYLQNAQAILPDTVPADWPVPVPKPDGRVTVGLKLVEAMIDHAALVFRHYADDDFDGTVDGIVVERFSETFPMFVADFVVARRAPGSARATSAWAFRHAITDTLQLLAPDADGTLRIPAIVPSARDTARTPGGGRPAVVATESADERMAFGTRMLGAVNRLAERCGPVKGAIRRP